MVDDVRYALGEEIGCGGLGRVLAAFDVRLRRRVAIKELHALADQADLRFRREARVTARLQHPSIVPVYDAGIWPSDRPFYAMKLVSGRTLRDAIEASPDLAARLALLPHAIAAAEAVAYAHSRGVIHRDLKPHNILVGDFGETVVVDWGLAKVLRAPGETESAGRASPLPAPDATSEGVVLGTPAYKRAAHPSGAARRPDPSRSGGHRPARDGS